MHDDLDLVVGRAEQFVGLDDLEALVHQRAGVDRDLRPHLPRRMSQRLFDADVGQFCCRAAAKRPAAGGQHDAGHLAPRRALERRHWWTAQCSLSTGTSSAPGGRAQRLDHRRAGDQALLVGQRQPLSRASVRTVTGNPAKPTTPLTTTSASSARSARSATTSANGNAAATSARRLDRRRPRPWGGTRGLGDQRLDRRSDTESDDLVADRLGTHDVQRLRTDRPRRTGYRHAHR